MYDPGLDHILRGFPNLVVEPKQKEYRVYHPAQKGKGSLWVVKQKEGYRIVSTGTTHSLDRDIERLTGTPGSEMSDRNHKWWKSVTLLTMDKIFALLAENK